MKIKKLFMCSICLIIVILLAGFTINAADIQLAIGTGGTGGGYYPMGGNVAALISEKLEGVTASAQVTAASLENIRLLQQNQVQLALVNGSIAYGYPEGSKMLQPMTYEGVSSIMSFGSADVVTVVLKDSPIKKMADLEGKRVGIGAPGSGTENINKCTLSGWDLYNLETGDMKIVPAYLSYTECTTALKDRRIDAAMYFITGRPGSAITDLSFTHDISIISYEKEGVEQLVIKFPFMTATIYEKGLYKGVDYDSLVIKAPDVFVCRSDLSEDLVYNITKVVHEGLPSLRQTGYSGWNAASLDRSVAGVVPMHPGAIKYYDELGVE